MAYGGYDYQFVWEKSSSKYICLICTLVSRDPQQATCCGQVFCTKCLDQLWKTSRRRQFECPKCCKLFNNNYFFDKRADMKIKCLQVYCSNKDESCPWKGDLKDIEAHLRECPYQMVSCSNDCGMDLQQRYLPSHLENDCPKRLTKCQYCDKEGPYQVIIGHHLDECFHYPVKCTNEGCDECTSRWEASYHKNSCPKEVISCEYSTVGCKEVMKREEQEQHNEIWMNEHLQLAVKEITELKSEKKCLQSQLKNLPNQYCPVIKMSGFAKVKDEGNSWYSPGFYTSPGGYKMCLCVDANGSGFIKGQVSCSIYLMSGDYDDMLEWPFRGKIAIELLNQLEDNNHKVVVKHCNADSILSDRARVINKERAWSFLVFSHIISHSHLSFHPPFNLQYLKDDTLYFRVIVEVTSNTKPWLV